MGNPITHFKHISFENLKTWLIKDTLAKVQHTHTTNFSNMRTFNVIVMKNLFKISNFDYMFLGFLFSF